MPAYPRPERRDPSKMTTFQRTSTNRVAAIKRAEARGSLGPFAPSPTPKNKEKASPINPTVKARESQAAHQDRISQEQKFGMTRGRKAKYQGD
mgnify:FL=1